MKLLHVFTLLLLAACHAARVPLQLHSPRILQEPSALASVGGAGKVCTFGKESDSSPMATVLGKVVGTFVPYGDKITTGLDYIASWTGIYTDEGGVQVRTTHTD